MKVWIFGGLEGGRLWISDFFMFDEFGNWRWFGGLSIFWAIECVSELASQDYQIGVRFFAENTGDIYLKCYIFVIYPHFVLLYSCGRQ